MRLANKYLLFGIGLGLLFPIIALICDTIFVKDLSFTGSNLLATYRSSFLHAIIMTAPVFLGASFLVAGFKAEKMEQNNKKLQFNNKSLLEMNRILDEFNYQVTHDLKTSLIEMESLSIMIQKHSTNKARRELIISKLVTSSINGASLVDDFTRKVDTIRENFEDIQSNNSEENKDSKESSKAQIIIAKEENTINSNSLNLKILLLGS